MDPAVGQTYTSCDYKTCAPLNGLVVAVDERTVTMLIERKRQKMTRRGFPIQHTLLRGTQTRRLTGSGRV